MHGSQVDTQRCSALSSVPMKMCSKSLQSLVSLLDKCIICPGHPDAQFIRMAESKKRKLMSRDRKNVVGRVDDFSPVTLNGEQYAKTIRVSTCELLVCGSKCASCVSGGYIIVK